MKPGLSFPPSDISNLQQTDSSGQATMEVRFLGLIGPSGVLPHWFNDLAVSRAQVKDFALVDFLDIFHHRLLTLFYLAWKRSRLAVNYRPGADDRMSGYPLSLIGLGTQGMRGRLGLPEESLIFCSGLLARQAPSAAAVEEAVRYMAGADAKVHQFVERLIPVEPATARGSETPMRHRGERDLRQLCQGMSDQILHPPRACWVLPVYRFLPGGDLLSRSLRLSAIWWGSSTNSKYASSSRPTRCLDVPSARRRPIPRVWAGPPGCWGRE